MKAILCLALLGACTTFAPIEANVCGNGILEPGEDCDTPDATCVACAITCTAVTDCPANYTCGVDRTCHAAGGHLGEPRTIDTVSVNDFRITDVDGDGIGDFMALSSTSLDVRHGDATGVLGVNQSFVTPTQSGVGNFAKLDTDQALDFVLPTNDGLVEYTSRYGIPSPVATPSTVIDKSASILAIFPLRPTVIALFVSVPTALQPHPDVTLIVLDFADSTTSAGSSITLCGDHVKAETFDATSVDIYDATGTNAVTGDYIVSYLGGAASAKTVCVLSIHLDPPVTSGKPVTALISAITPGVSSTALRPVLAQLDYASSDNCPYLVISPPVTTPPSGLPQAFDGSMDPVAKRCKFAAAPTALAMLPQGQAVVGRVPLKPQFFLAGADALVLPSGLWGWVPVAGAGTQIYNSNRPLKAAVSGDINGDGYTDAVLVPEGTDDMDLLIRYHDATRDGYQFLRIDTAAEPSTVLLADFDGNGLLDVEYTEQQSNTDGVGTHTRMMIAYGTPDQLLPPVQVANFDAVGAVVPIGFPSNEDPLSLSTDLLVTVPGSSQAVLTILLASPQRTMTPLLEPRESTKNGTPPVAPNYRDETQFHAAAIGNFFHDATDPQIPDVIAFATIAPGIKQPITERPLPAVTGWRVAGTATGLDSAQAPGAVMSGLVDCSPTSMPGGTTMATGLCTNATFATIPVGDHDALIGVDALNHAGFADPATWAAVPPNDPTPPTWPVAALTAGSAPLFAAAGDAKLNALFAADFGTGVKLVAAFGAGKTSKGTVFLCDTSASGSPTNCQNVATTFVTPVESTFTTCAGATSARFAPTGIVDLVVACHGANASALFRIEPSNGNTVKKVAGGLPPRLELVRAGDVNGDGVDDIVIIHGDPGAQTLQVMLQCTSRDAACKGEAQ